MYVMACNAGFRVSQPRVWWQLAEGAKIRSLLLQGAAIPDRLLFRTRGEDEASVEEISLIASKI
jgi:hypothetical protein